MSTIQGLSLGSPNANYSLCGDFRTLSKLILCAVMIRGRHRGLPVAIEWVACFVSQAALYASKLTPTLYHVVAPFCYRLTL